jgi:hypothetical protein
MQCECVAAVWVYFSMPSLFARRRVVHFIDNTGALSAMIHGYASKLDCARIVNAFHLLAAVLGLYVWFEWVPSKANVSDLPSRFAEEGVRAMFESLFPRAVLGPSVPPPVHTWVAALSSLDGVLAMFSARSTEAIEWP